jgi:hypothetical protein
MNLFMGVIIASYNRERDLIGKDFLLTDTQKDWVSNRMSII